MFEWINAPDAWIALFTLTGLEIVLGIDNIIFISILVGKLPEYQRQKGRIIGLGLAMGMRVLLLLSLFWIMQLTQPLFTLFTQEISGRDIILTLGGLFLLAKSTLEIHHSIEGEISLNEKNTSQANFITTLIQIALLDIVFSLDSVITAVGMAKRIEIMILAVMIAIFIMMIFAKAVGDFVDANPTIKMLALSFMILIGVTLIAEGLNFHISKGYIYFAMAFSLIVESLNIYVRKKHNAKAK